MTFHSSDLLLLHYDLASVYISAKPATTEATAPHHDGTALQRLVLLRFLGDKVLLYTDHTAINPHHHV